MVVSVSLVAVLLWVSVFVMSVVIIESSTVMAMVVSVRGVGVCVVTVAEVLSFGGLVAVSVGVVVVVVMVSI